MTIEHDLATALRKLVEVYREGQDNPQDEPQCIWQAIQALDAYEAAQRATSNEYLHSIIEENTK